MQLKCEIEVTNESLEQHFCCNVLTFAEALGIEKDVQSILHQHQLQSKYKDKTKTIMKTKEKTKTKRPIEGYYELCKTPVVMPRAIGIHAKNST